jgi:hypothetical protein
LLTGTRLPKNKNTALIYLLLFLTALLPRVLGLSVFVAPDEGKWIFRSAHFLQAVISGNLTQATSVSATPEVEVLAPAVPTMWSGALGLTAKYWFGGDTQAASLADFLAAIPTATEKIPLDFYPWARFPTVLLTSVSIVLFYFLLTKLIARPAAGVAAWLLALDPFFIGLSRVIHHDALVTIFITISLLTLLVHQKATPRRWGWLVISGISIGLALLTKPTALYLVLFAGIFLAWEIIKKPSIGKIKIQQLWLTSVIWSGSALAIFILLWPALWAAPLQTFTDLFSRAVSAADGSNNYSFIPRADNPLPELGFLFYPVNWLFKSTLPAWIGLAGLLIYRRNGTTPQSNWATKWLVIFAAMFLALLIPADTRDIRYFLPAVPALYALVGAGLAALPRRLVGLMVGLQLMLAAVYFPYYVDYWNPVIGGPWLAPRLVKIGSGEGLDQAGRYLSQKTNAAELTVAVSFWESFVPFFNGHYTKPHYNEAADYIVIYRRQIQNRNPFPEYWPYFAARQPEHKITLRGLDYVWIFTGPQLREVNGVDYAQGLTLSGYRFNRSRIEPGHPAELTLVWTSGSTTQTARVRLQDVDGRVWANAEGPVLDTAGPSAVEGHYHMEIPANTPRGDYELWVSVGDVSHLAGTVPVRQMTQPPASIPIAANFGNDVTLVGADAALDDTGRQINIKLVWQANQPINLSYTTFVHALDPAGQVQGQIDRIPGDGRWPTNTWIKDEWITDSFTITLTPDNPPGELAVVVGLYDFQTLERLPVIGGDAGQTVVFLTTINTQ